MADFRAVDTRKVAATTTAKEENFVTGCKGFIVSADAACFIDFDEVADSGSLYVPANTSTNYVPTQFTRFSVVAQTTANVYIMAFR